MRPGVVLAGLGKPERRVHDWSLVMFCTSLRNQLMDLAHGDRRSRSDRGDYAGHYLSNDGGDSLLSLFGESFNDS